MSSFSINSFMRRLGRHLVENKTRYPVYLGGCLSFSLGAYCFIYSGLGTDPLDTFALGVMKHMPMTIGIVQALVAAICIAIWALWNRRKPLVSPFVTFFFCGSLIDVLRITEAASWAPVSNVAFMLFGVILCAYGSSLIIMSGLGIRAMDLIAVTMTMRWKWPFWAAKASMEFILLVAGYILGGPVGVGTVCFLLFVNTLIQPFMWLNGRAFRLYNYGLPAATEVELVVS